jgi:uncharacterized membrane protein YedE/YeeE
MQKDYLELIVALIIGTLGYHLIFGAFLIDPIAPRLPPNAHIAPVSWVLVLGSFSFGLGMAIAGCCISAQLYRLGEGLLSALIAFIGIIFGFVLAFLSWNFLYLKAIQQAPIVWFPALSRIQRINHFTNYIVNFFSINTFKIS